MAKKDIVYIDIQTSDGGSMQKVAVSAKKLGIALDEAEKAGGRTGKSARTLDRNLKGTADMTANSTKGFSKMAQGMTGTLVPAYAVLASNVFAITAAFNFLRQAADFRVMQESQIAFTGATGVGMASLTKTIQEASGAMLNFQTAGEAAAIGIASGLGSGQIEALAEGAGNLSKILGRDVTDSFNRLVRGVTKAEPELLDELGITLRLADAQENYAATLQKSATDLTTYEKKQAVFAEVQDQLERKYNAVAAATDVQANAISRLGVAFDEVMKTVKGFINVIAEPVAEFFTKNVKSLAAALALLAVPIVRAIIPGLDNWKQKSKDSAEEASRAYEDAREELEKLEQQQKDMAAGKPVTGSITTQSAGLKKAGGDIDKLNKRQTAALLRNATRENKRLKHLTDEQLSTYKIMLKAKLRGKITWVEQIILAYNNMGQRMDVANKKMVARWKAAMAIMQGVAAKFTRGVDLLMKGLGIIGVVLMLKDLGVEVLRFLGFFKENEGIRDIINDTENLTQRVQEMNKEYKDFTKIQKTLRDENSKSISGRDTLQEAIATGRAVESYTKIVLESMEAFASQDQQIKGSIENVADLTKEQAALMALIEKGTQLDLRASGSPTNYGATFSDSIGLFYKENEAAEELRNTFSSILDVQSEYNNLKNISIKASRAYTSAEKELGVSMVGLNEHTKEAAKTVLDYFGSFKQSELTVFEAEYVGLLQEIQKGNTLTQVQADRFKELGENIADFGSRANWVKETLSATTTQYNQVTSSLKTYKTANSDLISSLEELRVEMQKQLDQKDSGMTKDEIDELDTRIAKLKRLRKIEIDFANKQLLIDKVRIKSLVGSTKLERERITRQAKLAKNLNEQEKLNAIIAEAGAKADTEKVRQYTLQLDILKAQTEELKRQEDATAQLIDSARQALETSLQGSISSLIKGDESSITDALLGIMNDVVDAMIDAFSKDLTESIMRMIPKYKSQEDKLRIAITEGHKTGAAEVKKQQDLATKNFATAINNAADRFALAVKASCTECCMGAGSPSPSPSPPPSDEPSIIERTDPAPDRDALLNQFKKAKNDEDIVPEKIEDKGKGFFSKLWGTSGGGDQSAPANLVMGGDPTVNVLANKPSGLKGLFSNFTSNFAAIFEKAEGDGGFLGKLGGLFSQLGTDLGGIFSTLKEGLQGLFGGDGEGIKAILGFFGFAKGGYTSRMRDYSTGGVAKGPRSGYPALLHGNEAVVPLPDGNSIPVSIPKGAGGGVQNNNVSVNISMDNNGNATAKTTSNEGSDLKILGDRIAGAVQQELLNQKRAGGILSPYGVS